MVPLLAESVAFGAAAQTGYILAILFVGGTLVPASRMPGPLGGAQTAGPSSVSAWTTVRASV